MDMECKLTTVESLSESEMDLVLFSRPGRLPTGSPMFLRCLQLCLMSVLIGPVQVYSQYNILKGKIKR